MVKKYRETDTNEIEESINTVSDKYNKLDVKKIKKTDNQLFKKLKNQRLENIEMFIKQFKTDFESLYDTTPVVIYTLKDEVTYPISLNELEKICDAFIEPNSKLHIREKNRKRNIVIARHIFFYIAYKMGYTTTYLGEYLGWDHASVIHGKKSVNNLLDINDSELVNKVKQIYDEVEKRIRVNTVIQFDTSKGDNT
jgi:hypothetical protein